MNQKTIMMIYSMFAAGQRAQAGNKIKIEKLPRPCLECRKNHYHNNAWCSAEHAAAWRAKNPNQGRVFV